MGILVDYFAASSDELKNVDFSLGPAGAGWPHVDCKGWVDGLTGPLSDLTGRDRSEFGRDVLVSSDDEDAEAWLARVRAEVTAALAGVSDERLDEYAEDEMLDETDAEQFVQLRDLARSAVESGRDLYCWSSL